jgi:hypothetical protein
MSINVVEKLASLQPTIFEEDSYSFLIFFQDHKVWYVYDSESLGLEFVNSQINKFALVDGRIPMFQNISSDLFDDYWSSVPLGVFRYKLLSDMTYSLLNDYKNTPGYIVEGMYWDNGFFYLVRDEDKIIQSKMFIDLETKQRAGYP